MSEFINAYFGGETLSRGGVFSTDAYKGSPLSASYYTAQGQPAKHDTHVNLVPWFSGSNNEVERLTYLVNNNPLLRGLIHTKAAIIAGQGLTLFRREGNEYIDVGLEEHLPCKRFHERNELDTWAFTELLTHSWVGNFFSRVQFSAGNSRVVRLEHINPEFVRAFAADDGTIRVKEYLIHGAWNNLPTGKITTGDTLPAWYADDFYDKKDKIITKAKAKTMLYHGRFRMPGMPYYATPEYYGALRWIELGNVLPGWHQANMANSNGMRLHIMASRSWIERKLNDLSGKVNPDTNSPYTEEDIMKALLKRFDGYFTKPENVGKTMASAFTLDASGKPVPEWIIQPISIDTKDDAYVKLGPMIDGAVTSAMGVDPSLAAILMNGKLSSGSEKRNAWNIEVMKSNSTRQLVLNLINLIHRFNRWPKNLEWGFRDMTLETTDNSPSGMAIVDAEHKNTDLQNDDNANPA